MELDFHQKAGSEPLRIGYSNLCSLRSKEELVFKIFVPLRLFSSFVFQRSWKLIGCRSVGFLLIESWRLSLSFQGKRSCSILVV